FAFQVGRLLRLEGIPLEEVEEIRFEYLYILKIDHLWVLQSLVKLSLNNNFIEKIENLETLIHLRELDLSFNKIRKIENLETLINLEKVTFYENLIETIENLDNQTKLTVISIGKNAYEPRLSLTSLNMAGNPCAEEQDYRLYVAAFLPTLVYYEYKRIDEDERKQGIDRFEETLGKLEREENEAQEKRNAIEKELSDAEMHSKMFVEYLNTGKLFEMMYEKDEEGTALLDIGDEVSELYEEYKTQFIDLCRQVFEVGQKHYTIRQAEVEHFGKGIEKAKQDNQYESIGYMESFLESKETYFSSIKDLKLQLEHDAITEDVFKGKIEEICITFDELIHSTWKNLMRLEVTLFEQIEEVNQTFEQTLAEMINTFIEEVQGVFTNVRAAEVTFSENMNDAAVRFMTAANVNPDEDIPESLKDILIDRDTLNNAMAATHDVHMQNIDAREDQLVHKAKGWLENLSEKLTKDEIRRNRYKLLEINHFLDIQREELEELTADQTSVPNPDNYDF
ncbi:hypothetical protein D910_07071, partial [Dendroctonus ponderosae]